MDTSIPSAAPTVSLLVPDHGKVGEDLRFASTWARDGVPALAYHWDFGDGTSDEGREVSHTYTMAGSYQVKLVVDGLDGVPAVKNATVEVSGSVTLPPPTRYVPE